jgi:hypothetical protein
MITQQGNGQIIADAMAILPVDAANRAIWTRTLTSTRTYNIYARWHATTDRATNATFTVYHAGGATPVQVNQQLNNATWVLLGSFTMGPGQNHRVELGDLGNNTYVVADAVAFSPADAPNRAIWTPALSQRDEFDIYGWWHATTDRATNAPFTIFRDGGTTAVTVNQQLNSATWTLLGTATLTPGAEPPGRAQRPRQIDAARCGVNVAAIAIAHGPPQCMNVVDQQIAGAWSSVAARIPPRLCGHGRPGLGVAGGLWLRTGVE